MEAASDFEKDIEQNAYRSFDHIRIHAPQIKKANFFVILISNGIAFHSMNIGYNYRNQSETFDLISPLMLQGIFRILA